MSVLAYENEEDRSSFSKYYTPSIEIKDYNVLTDQQPFFELSVKNKKEIYEKIVDTTKKLNDCTTGSLLDCEYFLNRYKLITVDLSRQDIDLTKQQINFIGRLDEDFATVFYIIENSERATL